jgi:glycosyltransferase involved in cell wall biosynthesis
MLPRDSGSTLKYAILTGEYPPQRGGVADYTRAVATELSEAGDDVQVWAPQFRGPAHDGDHQPVVHRLKGHFNPGDLTRLNRALHGSKPDRILVEYVPHAFGLKAMNLPFCLWLVRIGKHYPIWVMFHEVAVSIQRGQSARQKLLGAVTGLMAKLVSGSAKRVFVSTPSWNGTLGLLAPLAPKPEWLPVPSNILRCGRPDSDLRRDKFVSKGQFLVGHFGTYGDVISRILADVVPDFLERSPAACLLLLGTGGRTFAEKLSCRNPKLKPRINSVDFLAGHEVSHHIAICDLMLQPYPDGVTTRRGSVMAALAHAKPIVTTSGALTEPIWSESKAVAMAPASDTKALRDVAVSLLGDQNERRRVAAAGSSLYEQRFDLKHTIRAFRSCRS